MACPGPEFTVADEVAWSLNQVVGEGGEVDFDDGEGGGIPGGLEGQGSDFDGGLLVASSANTASFYNPAGIGSARGR